MRTHVHEHLPPRVARLALTFVISGALAYAQPQSQPLPNMGQQITPLAPEDSRFVPLNPDLPDNPNWLAGQAVTTVVSPDHKTLLVLTSGYNRVYTAACRLRHTRGTRPDSNEYVFIYDISTHDAGQEASGADPEYLQRDCLRSIRQAFLRGRRRERQHPHITLSADGTWAEEPGPRACPGHRIGVGLNGLSRTADAGQVDKPRSA